MRKLWLILILFLFPLRLRAQPGWFPLTLPWDDAAKTAIDASDLLIDYAGQDPSTVIDARGHLRAGSDGHFYFENSGKRARFWGVNFTFSANFPPCPGEPLRSGEPQDEWLAYKIARRLAKLGVNVVRFHHMDYFASPNGLWDPKYFPNDTQHLDAVQLKRLDYLIYQLRSNGIYVNLNLKVARHFGPGDGLEDTDQFKSGLRFFQGVSHFNQRMIELQKDYARQLLTHRNPYTGKTYAEDPGVAFVEIANEDSMFSNLHQNTLNYQPGVAGSLPQRYSQELDARWNRWLIERYGSREGLEAAWRYDGPAVDPSDKIRNGGFENGMSEWSVYPIGDARVTARVEAGAGPDGSAALRADVTSDGTNWHVQCVQQGHTIEKDRSYEITFYAKAANPGELTVDIMKGVSPWSNYGLSKTFQLTTNWQRFTGRFTANETDSMTVRPTFELGARNNTIWIDKVEFRQISPTGLETDESPERGSVRRPMRADLGNFTAARIIDLFRFYSEIDESYFGGMRRYLKEDLRVKAMVTGTAPLWAYLGDVAVQSQLDYVDGHYYWDHPSWPPGREWQPTGWKINNKPWINELQELAGLASQAVEGKPFTVSEFNEVFPNRYALEGPLLMALIANLQDWDAVYMFDYASNSSDFVRSYTTSFFTLAGNPVKTAQLPVAARIFLNRQNSTTTKTMDVQLARDELPVGFAKGLVNASQFLASKGLDRRAFLKIRQRIRTFDREQPAEINYRMSDGSVTSSNGELVWNRDNSQASYMLVKGPSVQGSIGFLGESQLDFDDWSLEVRPGSPDHLAVLLQSRAPASLRETSCIILSVWSEHQNTGMIWNETQTSLDDRWGTDPVIVRPAYLTVTFRFAGARSLKMYPLDEKGNPKAALPAGSTDSGIRYQIDTARDRTTWYLIELNEAASSANFTVPRSGLFQLYTESDSNELKTGWLEMENRSGAALRPTLLLEYSTRGILTSTVRLPVSGAKTLVRIPVTRNEVSDTAVAILNREQTENWIGGRLLDSSGVEIASGWVIPLSPGKGVSRFVRELVYPKLPPNFEGILELASRTPFYVMALRSMVNAAGDFALTPYPPESTSNGPLYFAHLAVDESYTSEVLLWNSQTESITTRLEFFAPDGQPASVGRQPQSADIDLLPARLRRITLARSNRAFYGYARLTLVSGAALPSATAVTTRWEGGAPAAEVGIPATPSLTEEVLLLAERPSQWTGLALLNPTAAPTTVELEILGSETPVPDPTLVRINLGPWEKKAFFIYEVFPNLPRYLNALLRVKAGSNVATLALLGITNERNHFLMASLTGGPGREPLSAGSLAVMPRFATGAGYRTLIYLLPEKIGSTESQGQIRFFSDTSGTSQALLFR